MMSRLLINNYIFDPANRRITLPDVATTIPGFQLAYVKIITNIHDGSVIYLPQSKSRHGTWNGSYIQLQFDTTGMVASDELQIVVADSNLLDRQLRATPIQVVGPLTNAELREVPVPVNIGQTVSAGPIPTAWNKLFNHYIFDPANNKVRFPVWPLGYMKMYQNQIVRVVNTTKNRVLYCPSTPGHGGALIDENGMRVLVIDTDTSEMAPTDNLQIVLAIPPATHYARNKSVVIKNVELARGGNDLQEFTIEPTVPIESQLDFSAPLQLDPQERCLQVVKLSSDSIDQALISLYSQLIPGDLVGVDNFNSYLDTTSLRQAWVQSNTQLDVQLATGDDAYEGTGAMSFMIKQSSIGSSVSRIYASDQDWSERSAIHFYHRSSIVSTGVIFRMRIRDANGSWAYRDIVGAALVDWHDHTAPLHELIPEVNSIDFARIREIQFVPITRNAEVREYIDLIEILGWSEHEPEIEVVVYDFGTTEPMAADILPPPLVLGGGVWHRNFSVGYGPGIIGAELQLEDLVRGNYYGIAVRNLSNYHRVIMLGSPEQKYMSGGTYLLNNGNIEERLNMSLAFSVTSQIPSFYHHIELTFDDDPGRGSLLWISLLDNDGRMIHAIASMTLRGQRHLMFDCADEDFNYWWERGVQTIRGYFQGNSSTKAAVLEVKSSIFHAKHKSNG